MSYPCPICGEMFDTWEQMNKHASNEADEAMEWVRAMIPDPRLSDRPDEGD